MFLFLLKGHCTLSNITVNVLVLAKTQMFVVTWPDVKQLLKQQTTC